jgi:hypothetical protein
MSPSVGAKSTVRPRWSFTAPSSTLAPESLAAQIARVLGIEPQPAPLSAQERGLAEALNRDKYVRREWAFRRQPALTTVLSTKARSGVVTLEARMEGNIIAEAQVRGDFLLPNQGEMERVLKRKPLAWSWRPAPCRKTLKKGWKLSPSATSAHYEPTP